MKRRELIKGILGSIGFVAAPSVVVNALVETPGFDDISEFWDFEEGSFSHKGVEGTYTRVGNLVQVIGKVTSSGDVFSEMQHLEGLPYQQNRYWMMQTGDDPGELPFKELK